MGGILGGLTQNIESNNVEEIVKPQPPPPVEDSKPMSTQPKQAEKEPSEALATDLPTNQPGPESPEATKNEEEEEEGECGFCVFMKGGGCKVSFVDWENCMKEAEDNDEDLVEKCGPVTDRLKQCMDAHSDYYEPILRAEKHAEQQAVIELEKEKQDSEASNSQQEDSKPTSTPPKQVEKEQSEAEATDLPTNQPSPKSPEATDLPTDQPGSEAKSPEATKNEEEEEEEEGECGFCLFMKGGGCKESFVDWENCVKEAEDNNEDLVEKCGPVTARLKQCMDAHSDYYEPILRAEKHAEEQAVIELEKEKQDSEASNSQQEEKAASNSDQK